MTFYYLEMYNLQCNIANVPSLVPGVQSRLEWPGPGWRGLARPGCLSPGPGPGTSQHANIVTVGRERERERDGEGAASECLQTSTGRDGLRVCAVILSD